MIASPTQRSRPAAIPASKTVATVRQQRATTARAASGRRRNVDPTTCERDYLPAEMEFMQAIQKYKLESGRQFPTWSEVLEVLIGLGYQKPDCPSHVDADTLVCQGS